MCSLRVFPVAPGFHLLCFAQSHPLPHLYRWAKGDALHLSIESSILGSLHSFNFVFVMSRCKRKKGWTCEAPPTN